MSYEEAEKFLTYLINKYDKNKDGKFDYTGLYMYTINITVSFLTVIFLIGICIMR